MVRKLSVFITGHADCLKVLLSFECNVTAQDKYGDTAERVAQRHNHSECIRMIKESLNPAPHKERKVAFKKST